MAISNTKILIKRSSTTNIPSGLQAGELAYSFASNTLFLGNTTGTGVVNIGGYLYTSTIDAATAANTSNTLVKRASDGSFAGQLYGTANLAVALSSPQNFSISGGDITASAQSFQGNNSVTLSASLNSIPGLSAGYYGSSTTIPTFQIGANGRILSVTSNTIATSFTVAGNTGSSIQAGGSVLEVVGGSGSGINTSISANGSGANVVISTDTTIARTNTTSVGPQTISTDLTVAGNLIVTGTQTFINTSTVQTNDSLIKLAANNTVADVLDIGFYGQSNTGSSIQYHGLIREGSGGSSAGNFYLFKNLTTDPTSNVINYASLSKASLIADLGLSSNVSLTTGVSGILPVANGGTGTSTSTGTGSVVLSNGPTFGAQTTTIPSLNVTSLNVSTLNVTTLNVTTTYVSAISTNTVNVGSLSYNASGAFVVFGANANSYQQVVAENANTGTNASVDFIVSTIASTDTTLYGDFGMNGPNFNGSGTNNGALDKANNVYLFSQGTDLAIGTTTSNAIHFVVNDGATDAMTIQSNGVVSLGAALTTVYGGTGNTTFNTNGIVYGGSSLASTVAAGTADQTWSNQILTVTNVGTPVWSTTLDGGVF
jgi:hypothetical protein